MVLNMYLIAKIYPFLLKTDTLVAMYPKLQEIVKMALPIDEFIVTSISVQIGSWRKASAIHKWFVDNLNKGVDNREEIFVPENELNNLLNLCLEVKQSPEKAPTLLPIKEGFFFGSTEYDELYYQNIDHTIDILRLAERAKADIYYQAIW